MWNFQSISDDSNGHFLFVTVLHLHIYHDPTVPAYVFITTAAFKTNFYLKSLTHAETPSEKQ